jgi:hypothetical protein
MALPNALRTSSGNVRSASRAAGWNLATFTASIVPDLRPSGKLGHLLQGIERLSPGSYPGPRATTSGYASGVMSSAAVRQVIALAAELSEEERRVVIDAIAPRESVAGLAAEWEAEIARRAEPVRTGQPVGKPANEVFDRLEARLKAR